ncbi:MAG TPA: hypothetical protein VMU96_07460 [Casimicrobiaceae bacterium]|nr:hypothetical protein [Casimicrobiaceae bacterium]
MSSRPVKRKSRSVRAVEGGVVDPPTPVSRRRGTGFSFRYTYAEFSAVGSSAQFKAKRARYEDGRLTAESIEGELDPALHARLIDDVQRFFVDQTALYLRAFGSLLLPFNRGPD